VVAYLVYNAGYGGDANGDTLVGIEHLWGSAYADILVGSASANAIIGDGGNDFLVGGGGSDYLVGGAGGDCLYFEAGDNGADLMADFTDGVDYFCFALAAAANFSALTISGNGTNAVTVGYAGGSVVVQGASPITLTAADFVFA
jgi:Ca2+-binding RTX toxin-like protein